MRLIMKFGGTSVGGSDAIRRVVTIVREIARHHQVVVVVSAMNAPHLRTTDTLIMAARAAEAGDASIAEAAAPQLLGLYLEAAQQLATPDECQILADDLRAMFTHITNLMSSIAILGELTPRALDLISGQGERCNARLIAAALRSSGLAATAVDATGLIVTDDRYGNANPQMTATREQSQARLLPLIAAGTVPVITGFLGATSAGVPTTLGRGGSDYSCAILGAVLDADEIWFWKEVDGVMTSNPKLVPEARSIPLLSYTEMSELSYYGANVLHPRTVYPAVERNIPLRIRNTFNPQHPGTCITGTSVKGTVKAITAIRGVSLITVGGPGLQGLTGAAARTFGAVARAGVNTLLIAQASSEQSITFAVLRDEADAAIAELQRELATFFSLYNVNHIDVEEAVAILAVVGSGMQGAPGISGRVFGALGAAAINVIAIAQGHSEYNISVVVADTDTQQAVQAIHSAFQLEQSPPMY